jgi:hypothetical protein
MRAGSLELVGVLAACNNQLARNFLLFVLYSKFFFNIFFFSNLAMVLTPRTFGENVRVFESCLKALEFVLRATTLQ